MRTILGVSVAIGAGVILLVGAGASAADEVAKGRALFLREWMPDDPRATAETASARSTTTARASPVITSEHPAAPAPRARTSRSSPRSKCPTPATARKTSALGGLGFMVGALSGSAVEEAKPEPGKLDGQPPAIAKKPDVESLAKSHAGFRSARSVVLHRYSVDPTYQSWRLQLLGNGGSVPIPLRSKEDRALADIRMVRLRGISDAAQDALRPFMQSRADGFQLLLSRRNTPPLFGVGLIDKVPVEAIEAAARQSNPSFPEVRGRVSRLKGGKIGRFGWKGQTPDLKEFVLTACAVELGLEVPGHSQGGIPNAPHYKSAGLDLDERECTALIAYVRALPAPAVREASGRKEAEVIRAGKEAFQAIGCATCHTPKLGEVEGLYSDLLLHDMGDELSDTGSYGVFVPDSPAPPSSPDGSEPAPTRREWRTPPLWGFRDSGPYMHDGRADDLEQAVAQHDGQAARSAQRFFMLSPRERLKVEAFLKSLTAPTEPLGAGG